MSPNVLRLLIFGTLSAVLSAVPGAAQSQIPPRSTFGPLGSVSGVLTLASPLSPRVFLPGGDFRLGSSPDEIVKAFASCTDETLGKLCRVELFSHEGPERRVRLSGFWIGRHEVTVSEYERCVALGRCDPIPYFKGAMRFSRKDLPATLVTWNDARDYCASVGGRLPTEAEFERAARGRTRRQFPWGDLYNSRVSNHGRLATTPHDPTDGFVELARVGSFPDGATPELVFDLAGNVEEWVSDRYAPEYNIRDRVNPQGPSAGLAGNRRVVRGGSYESPKAWLRGASRDSAEPSERSTTRGFRCAWSSVGSRQSPEGL